MVESRRVAIVTGAAGGVGQATCRRLIAAGWSVVGVDCDAERLSWMADTPHAVPCVADVGTESGCTRMVRLAKERFGGLDCLICNAGVSMSGPIGEISLEAVEAMIAVNVRGPIFGVRAALPELRRRPGSNIVIVASTHGIAGDAGFSVYSATKHAAVGFAKSLARELGPLGVRVNAVCPGPIRGTGMSAPIEQNAPAAYDAIRRAVPLRRWAEADEIAAVIEFLASPNASFVSGVALPVDGAAVAGSGLTVLLEHQERT